MLSYNRRRSDSPDPNGFWEDNSYRNERPRYEDELYPQTQGGCSLDHSDQCQDEYLNSQRYDGMAREQDQEFGYYTRREPSPPRDWRERDYDDHHNGNSFLFDTLAAYIKHKIQETRDTTCYSQRDHYDRPSNHDDSRSCHYDRYDERSRVYPTMPRDHAYDNDYNAHDGHDLPVNERHRDYPDQRDNERYSNDHNREQRRSPEDFIQHGRYRERHHDGSAYQGRGGADRDYLDYNDRYEMRTGAGPARNTRRDDGLLRRNHGDVPRDRRRLEDRPSFLQHRPEERFRRPVRRNHSNSKSPRKNDSPPQKRKTPMYELNSKKQRKSDQQSKVLPKKTTPDKLPSLLTQVLPKKMTSDKLPSLLTREHLLSRDIFASESTKKTTSREPKHLRDLREEINETRGSRRASPVRSTEEMHDNSQDLRHDINKSRSENSQDVSSKRSTSQRGLRDSGLRDSRRDRNLRSVSPKSSVFHSKSNVQTTMPNKNETKTKEEKQLKNKEHQVVREVAAKQQMTSSKKKVETSRRKVRVCDGKSRSPSPSPLPDKQLQDLPCDDLRLLILSRRQTNLEDDVESNTISLASPNQIGENEIKETSERIVELCHSEDSVSIQEPDRVPSKRQAKFSGTSRTNSSKEKLKHDKMETGVTTGISKKVTAKIMHETKVEKDILREHLPDSLSSKQLERCTVNKTTLEVPSQNEKQIGDVLCNLSLISEDSICDAGVKQTIMNENSTSCDSSFSEDIPKTATACAGDIHGIKPIEEPTSTYETHGDLNEASDCGKSTELDVGLETIHSPPNEQYSSEKNQSHVFNKSSSDSESNGDCSSQSVSTLQTSTTETTSSESKHNESSEQSSFTSDSTTLSESTSTDTEHSKSSCSESTVAYSERSNMFKPLEKQKLESAILESESCASKLTQLNDLGDFSNNVVNTKSEVNSTGTIEGPSSNNDRSAILISDDTFGEGHRHGNEFRQSTPLCKKKSSPKSCSLTNTHDSVTEYPVEIHKQKNCTQRGDCLETSVISKHNSSSDSDYDPAVPTKSNSLQGENDSLEDNTSSEYDPAVGTIDSSSYEENVLCMSGKTESGDIYERHGVQSFTDNQNSSIIVTAFDETQKVSVARELLSNVRDENNVDLSSDLPLDCSSCFDNDYTLATVRIVDQTEIEYGDIEPCPKCCGSEIEPDFETPDIYYKEHMDNNLPQIEEVLSNNSDCSDNRGEYNGLGLLEDNNCVQENMEKHSICYDSECQVKYDQQPSNSRNLSFDTPSPNEQKHNMHDEKSNKPVILEMDLNCTMNNRLDSHVKFGGLEESNDDQVWNGEYNSNEAAKDANGETDEPFGSPDKPERIQDIADHINIYDKQQPDQEQVDENDLAVHITSTEDEREPQKREPTCFETVTEANLSNENTSSQPGQDHDDGNTVCPSPVYLSEVFEETRVDDNSTSNEPSTGELHDADDNDLLIHINSTEREPQKREPNCVETVTEANLSNENTSSDNSDDNLLIHITSTEDERESQEKEPTCVETVKEAFSQFVKTNLSNENTSKDLTDKTSNSLLSSSESCIDTCIEITLISSSDCETSQNEPRFEQDDCPESEEMLFTTSPSLTETESDTLYTAENQSIPYNPEDVSPVKFLSSENESGSTKDNCPDSEDMSFATPSMTETESDTMYTTRNQSTPYTPEDVSPAKIISSENDAGSTKDNCPDSEDMSFATPSMTETESDTIYTAVNQSIPYTPENVSAKIINSQNESGSTKDKCSRFEVMSLESPETESDSTTTALNQSESYEPGEVYPVKRLPSGSTHVEGMSVASSSTGTGDSKSVHVSLEAHDPEQTLKRGNHTSLRRESNMSFDTLAELGTDRSMIDSSEHEHLKQARESCSKNVHTNPIIASGTSPSCVIYSPDSCSTMDVMTSGNEADNEVSAGISSPDCLPRKPLSGQLNNKSFNTPDKRLKKRKCSSISQKEKCTNRQDLISSNLESLWDAVYSPESFVPLGQDAKKDLSDSSPEKPTKRRKVVIQRSSRASNSSVSKSKNLDNQCNDVYSPGSFIPLSLSLGNTKREKPKRRRSMPESKVKNGQPNQEPLCMKSSMSMVSDHGTNDITLRNKNLNFGKLIGTMAKIDASDNGNSYSKSSSDSKPVHICDDLVLKEAIATSRELLSGAASSNDQTNAPMPQKKSTNMFLQNGCFENKGESSDSLVEAGRELLERVLEYEKSNELLLNEGHDLLELAFEESLKNSKATSELDKIGSNAAVIKVSTDETPRSSDSTGQVPANLNDTAQQTVIDNIHRNDVEVNIQVKTAMRKTSDSNGKTANDSSFSYNESHILTLENDKHDGDKMVKEGYDNNIHEPKLSDKVCGQSENIIVEQVATKVVNLSTSDNISTGKSLQNTQIESLLTKCQVADPNPTLLVNNVDGPFQYTVGTVVSTSSEDSFSSNDSQTNNPTTCTTITVTDTDYYPNHHSSTDPALREECRSVPTQNKAIKISLGDYIDAQLKQGVENIENLSSPLKHQTTASCSNPEPITLKSSTQRSTPTKTIQLPSLEFGNMNNAVLVTDTNESLDDRPQFVTHDLKSEYEEKMIAILQKRVDVEKAYRKECESALNKVKSLARKKKSTREELQKMLQTRLRDVSQKYISELQSFVRNTTD